MGDGAGPTAPRAPADGGTGGGAEGGAGGGTSPVDGFAALAGVVPDPMVLLDPVRGPDGRIVDFRCVGANDAACARHRRTGGPLAGALLLDLAPGLVDAGIFARYVHAVETGTPLDLPDVAYPEEGDVHPAHRVWLHGGPVDGRLVLLWRDVTEQDLHERQYRLLAEYASEVVFRITRDGIVDWASPSLTDSLGWDVADVVGHSFREFTHPDDAGDRDLRALRAATGGGVGVGHARLRLRHAAGGHHWFDLTFREVRDGDGAVVGWVGTLRCVDGEVAAESALAESERRYRRLVENSADVVYEADASGRFTWISPAVTAVLGYGPADLVGADLRTLVHPEDLGPATGAMARMEAGRLQMLDVRVVRADGSPVWVRVRSMPVLDGSGRAVGRVGSFYDVDAEVAAVRALAESEARYRLLVENESDIVFRSDPDGIIEWISPSVTDLTGRHPERIVGHRVDEFIHPGDHDTLSSAVLHVLAGEDVSWQGRLAGESGPGPWIAVRSRPLLDGDGTLIGAVSSIRDVDDEVHARAALTESEERFRLTMSSAPIGMAVVDLDRRFVEVNTALCTMLGRSADWLEHHRVADVVHPDDDALDLRMRAEVLGGRLTGTTREKRLVRPDGSVVWVQHSIGLQRDGSGVPLSYVSTFADVTEAKSTREQLAYQATHDALTHLVNRRDLFDHADEVLSHAPRSGTRVAVLYIDVDGLKAINDTLGHAAGDAALVAVADRLAAVGRVDDVVSRIGGDEFVILLPGLHAAGDAEAIAAKILDSLQAPIVTDEGTIRIGVSIGIALAEDGEDADDTLRRADAALYRAKEKGRGRWAEYDPALDGGRHAG